MEEGENACHAIPHPRLDHARGFAECVVLARVAWVSTHLHTGQQGARRSVPAPPSRHVSAPPNVSLTLPILIHAHAGHCWCRHAGCWRCESSSTLPQTTPSSLTQLAHIRTSLPAVCGRLSRPPLPTCVPVPQLCLVTRPIAASSSLLPTCIPVCFSAEGRRRGVIGTPTKPEIAFGQLNRSEQHNAHITHSNTAHSAAACLIVTTALTCHTRATPLLDRRLVSSWSRSSTSRFCTRCVASDTNYLYLSQCAQFSPLSLSQCPRLPSSPNTIASRSAIVSILVLFLAVPFCLVVL
jgi:hypothetical protein